MKIEYLVQLTVVTITLAMITACRGDGPFERPDQLGDTYEIRLQQTTRTSGGGGSGSSSSNVMLVETVIGLRADGVELEFDLPPDTSEEDRARDWQFPAEVFKPRQGAFKLLNEANLESRIADWLNGADIDRSACGQWVFTWTAVKIECDPKSVLETLEPFDLRLGPLEAGVPYRAVGAPRAVPLTLEETGPEGRVFSASFNVDRVAVRRARAEADMAVAQMLGEPELSLEEALEARPLDSIAGSMAVTIHVDADGRLTRLVRKTVLDIEEPLGFTSHEESEETLIRTFISGDDREG